MKVLITGATGFVGRHLIKELLSHGHQPVAVDINTAYQIPDIPQYQCDILSPRELTEVVLKTMPDACIHLAGIAFVPAADKNPEIMLSINVLGTLNILNVLARNCAHCRTLTISTGHVYGMPPPDRIVKETDVLRPVSLYAITKAAADSAALGFTENDRLPVMTARPNNHTGPGQSPDFVVPGFIKQAKEIAAGKKEAVIHVGNLDSVRDFTDVRDVVRAYRLLIEKGIPGNAYNIASSNTTTIGNVLEKICEFTDIQPEIIVDQEKYRPTDNSPVLSTEKIKQHTGWQPEYCLTQTLHDMLA